MDSLETLSDHLDDDAMFTGKAAQQRKLALPYQQSTLPMHSWITIDLMKVAFYGLLTLSPATAMAADVATGAFEGFGTVVKPFMEAHCMDCHGPNKQKAGFRVDTLAGDLNNGTEALHWREIVDIVNSGEMPPEGRPRPDSARSAVVTQWIHEALTRAEMARASDGGRVVMRRLTRAEYLNTMRDLFGFTSDPIAANSLPADTSALGFDNIGAVMTMDPVSLGQYVDVAGDIVQLATAMGQTKPVTQTQRWEGEAYQGKANPQAIKKAYEQELKRATAEGNPPPTLSEVEERLRNEQLNKSYAMRDDAIGIKRKAGAGRRLQFSVKNIQPGDYRLRVRAAKEQHHSEWPVQLGMGLKMGSFRAPESGRLESSLTEEMGVYSSIAHNHTYRGDGTLVITFDFSDRRPSGETSGIEDTHPALQGVSEQDLLLVDWVELEGPLVETWPPAPYATLFFEGPRSQPDREYADRILQRFLSRAFRGPVELEQKNKYLEIYDLAVAEKYSFEEALGFAAQAACHYPNRK